ncbi:hypothetical protein [Cryobacterium sp. BB736]|uniref:hypothetical protein n=1 Tax=Cryobacterium sp. BB736 TaxID=2746963 RepID=UPI00187483DD|nr:hypothetical protein [Cryobacterium sp. BB736]
MQSNGDTPHPGAPDPNDAPTDRLPAGESIENAAPDAAQQPDAAAGAPLNQGDLSDEPTQPLPPVREEGAAPPAGEDVFASHVPVAGAAAGGGASMGAGLPSEGGGPGGPTEPSGGRRSVLPWILGGIALLLVAGIASLFAVGFQRGEEPATSPTETPAPSVSVPSVTFGPIEPTQPPGEPVPEPTQAPPPPPAPDEPEPTEPPAPSTPAAPSPSTPPPGTTPPEPSTPAP